MSDLEHRFIGYIERHPEIRATYNQDLINIRALARHFMKEYHINNNIEAVVAMIRRTNIKPLLAFTNKKIFADIKISIKDEITILDYEKSKMLMEKLKDIVSKIDYDKNETLKVVVGSQTIKIIVDSSNSNTIKQLLSKIRLIKEYKRISETSLIFSQKALDEKGIVAYVTSKLLMNDINIREIITCTPELIIYFDEEQSLKAYEIFKGIKQINDKAKESFL